MVSGEIQPHGMVESESCVPTSNTEDELLRGLLRSGANYFIKMFPSELIMAQINI